MNAWMRIFGVFWALAGAVSAFAAAPGAIPETVRAACEPGADSVSTRWARLRLPCKGTKYQYDPASNRTSLKDQDGKLVYYDWDAANRMSEVRSADYGGWLAYYEYNAADRMEHQRNQNGTVIYHGYDAAGRVSRIHHRKSDGTHLDYLDFTRDEAGNPLLIDVQPHNLASDHQYIYFNYDPANRISREMWKDAHGSDIYGFDYAYDEAGNRRHKMHFAPGSGTQYWDYDAADQLQKQFNGGTTMVYFEFDQNANLAVEHDVDRSAGRTYYDYESRNLLSRVDFPGATATNYFYYNGLAERVRRDDSTGGKVYTWDGIDVVVEKNRATGASMNRLIKGYAPVAGIGPYVMIDLGATGSVKLFFHKNQVGSTLLLTGTAGAVGNTFRSDAWGQPFEASGPSPALYRFNGKELDPDFVAFNSNNRRYHYPLRSYTPFRAAFLQRDPLLHTIRTSHDADILRATLRYLYGYAAMNPTDFVDPMGLKKTTARGKRTQIVNDVEQEWEWAFDIEPDASNCRILVTVVIELEPDPDVTNLKEMIATWEQGIFTAWNSRAKLCCKGCNCPDGFDILIVPVFTQDAWSPHATVRISRTPPAVNRSHWSTQNRDSATDAQHEIGHMLGNIDEYGNNSGFNHQAANPGGVMDNASEPAERRHFVTIANEANQHPDLIGFGCVLKTKDEKC